MVGKRFMSQRLSRAEGTKGTVWNKSVGFFERIVHSDQEPEATIGVFLLLPMAKDEFSICQIERRHIVQTGLFLKQLGWN